MAKQNQDPKSQNLRARLVLEKCGKIYASGLKSSRVLKRRVASVQRTPKNPCETRSLVKTYFAELLRRSPVSAFIKPIKLTLVVPASNRKDRNQGDGGLGSSQSHRADLESLLKSRACRRAFLKSRVFANQFVLRNGRRARSS